jgi:hypothetical protein
MLVEWPLSRKPEHGNIIMDWLWYRKLWNLHGKRERYLYKILTCSKSELLLKFLIISLDEGSAQYRVTASTAERRKTRTNIHALNGIRTYVTINKEVKSLALNRAATVSGKYKYFTCVVQYARQKMSRL